MDFQQIVDGIGAMTCVISVEKLENGEYGDIRIVTGNRSYIDSIEKPMGGVEMLKSKFIPNSLYTDYLPRDLNFESYCYQAAVEKKCMHTCAHPERFNVWFNMTLLPLVPDEGNLCYCTYTMEIRPFNDSSVVSGVAGDVAAEVLETCFMLRGATDFKAAMKDVIEDIRQMCSAKLCCILLMDQEARTCSIMCEAMEEGAWPETMTEMAGESFYELAESWEDTISGSSCLIIKNQQEMNVVRERNPKWYESLVSNHVETLVLFPLKFSDKLLGYIWVTNFDAENAGMIKDTLELTTFILGSEIANDMLLDRLQVLSSRDMLTGLLNRNRMIDYMDDLTEGKLARGKTIGAAFADLNGLKTVNDFYGHSAGDELLINAARALREVFADSEVFRAGGDEFTVLVTGITPEEMAEKVRKLHEVSEHYNRVSFAVGYDWGEDARCVREVLHQADEKMYEAKKNYYRERGK